MEFDTEDKVIDGWRAYSTSAILAQMQQERLNRVCEWGILHNHISPKQSWWTKFKHEVKWKIGVVRTKVAMWIAGDNWPDEY